MTSFRYSQFCPMARAVEVVGERWTLLVLRELLLGPRRFSDLQRALSGVSSSVLSHRLGRLEERGVVTRRELPPPAPATLYELTPMGRALEPTLIGLARWGTHFLGPPQAGDHIEPAWVRLGLRTFARRGATPARSFNLRVLGPGPEDRFAVAGGAGGTEVFPRPLPAADAFLEGEAIAFLGLAAGALPAEQALASGALRCEGDAGAVAEFPALFDTQPPTSGETGD